MTAAKCDKIPGALLQNMPSGIRRLLALHRRSGVLVLVRSLCKRQVQGMASNI